MAQDNSSSKVSIGLPVYNGERYIARAIESILAQTYEDLELIISDNASTDQTEQICRQYADRDPRIRYYRQPVNLGAAPNFNVVFELSEPNKYFKWAAHDDYIHATYISRCVEELDRRPEAVLAYTTQAIINDHGDVERIYKDLHLSACLACEKDSTRFHNTLWRLRDTHPVFGLMRRDALTRTRLITNSVEPDRTLLGEMSLLGPFIRIPEALLFRALHPPVDQWRWLNPTNARWARWATPRIVGHHLEALRRSAIHPMAKVWLALDVLVAMAVRRTHWRIKKVKWRIRRLRGRGQRRTTRAA